MSQSNQKTVHSNIHNPVNALITDNIDLWTSAIKKRNATGRGSNKKIELSGIKKLRELILELAVRGKLVPQDANDEPASILLERIAEEKKQLLREKLIKKPKKLSDIVEEEVAMSLPQGWEFVRLNDLGEWGAGATPRRGNAELYGGDIPWFKSGELSANYIDKSEETVTELALKQSSLRYNKIGDVLLAMYGATIGKTAILKVRATTNQAVCACTPFTGFSNVFLLTLLKAYRPRFICMGTGGAQPNISREKIIATIIALPPLAEQQRIVAKVDELMVLCDQLEQQTEQSLSAHQTLVEVLLAALTKSDSAVPVKESFQTNWQRLAEHFDVLFTTEASIEQLKQTILQLAVMGKLVSQNPNDEPASVLLEKIAKEKARLIADKKIKKNRSVDTIIKEQTNWIYPQNWSEIELQDLFNFIDYRGKNPKKSESGKRLITAKNIRNGFIKNDPVEYISEDLYKTWMIRGFPKHLDILFVTEGHTMGFVSLVELDYEFALAQRTICFQPFNKVDTKFFFYSLMTDQFQNIINDNQTGSTAGGIKASKLKRIPVPVPPLPEQHRIVAKVDELMTLCDQLKAQLNNVQTTQLHLADAVVNNALKTAVG